MPETTSLFHDINPGMINALYNIANDSNPFQQLIALTKVGERLAETIKDPYLKQLITLQYELEAATMQFKHKKTVKVTSLYKSIMIADAVQDKVAVDRHVANLAVVIECTRDITICQLEKQIHSLKESKDVTIYTNNSN